MHGLLDDRIWQSSKESGSSLSWSPVTGSKNALCGSALETKKPVMPTGIKNVHTNLQSNIFLPFFKSTNLQKEPSPSPGVHLHTNSTQLCEDSTERLTVELR